jgi:hypothetical protein
MAMLPEAVQAAMRSDNKTYDYYRSRFKSDVTSWASYAASPEQSILYWLNYDYINNARQRMANQRADERWYHFIEPEDEQRLNAVMREIDPYFTAIDTSRNAQRLRQNATWEREQEARRREQENAQRTSPSSQSQQPAPPPTSTQQPSRDYGVGDFLWDIGTEALREILRWETHKWLSKNRVNARSQRYQLLILPSGVRRQGTLYVGERK